MAKHQDNCEICKRLDECRAGTHPGLIAELDTGFAVLGDSQQFAGYSLLLCKEPATELEELSPTTRLRFMEEMSQLASAVGRAVKPWKLNYEMLGNVVHHLHWHVFPRRESDPQPRAPVWGQIHPAGSEAAERASLSPQAHAELIRSIRSELESIRRKAG
jgi:diadenosine tetraphosphate (Ap4A) HIT family hydrolase